MEKRNTRLLAICFVSLAMMGTGQVFAQIAPADSGALLQSLEVTRKAPYLIYNGNNTQMQVLWQLTSTDSCTIEWGTDTLYAMGSAQTYEYGSYHQHTYTIADLTPGSKYHYRVTVDGESHVGSFRSAPDTSAAAVKFLAYGDTRTYPANHDQVAAAMIANYSEDEEFQSLILSVGDLVGNGNSEVDWDSQFFNPSYPNIKEMLASFPYQSCMGNHEGTGTLYKRYFPYPYVAGRYWSFDYGPAHFVVVDQYTSYGPGSAQLTWIESDLASTTKPWKFIYLHEPGWSAGNHENEVDVQNYIQPLCEQYGVSILFAGHNHYYARAIVNGVQHVTTGGGGAPLYTPNPTYPNVVSTARAYHFCAVEIDGDVLDYKAITSAGVAIDSFTITPPVGVTSDEAEASVPEFVLYPAFPNPCNSSTTISFSIPTTSNAELNIYNIMGQKIKTVVDEKLEAGYYNFSWNGKDGSGQDVSSGLYIYKLHSDDATQCGKIMLLR